MNAKLATRLCLILFACISVRADETAHVLVSLRDLGLQTNAARVVILQPRAPYIRSLGTNLFTRDPRRHTTDSSGVCIFSNTVSAYYQLQVLGDVPSGLPHVNWRLDLGTNHSGLVNAIVLLTDPDVLPPNPATNYYTIAQADAIHTGLIAGTASYTNNDAPAGVVTGFGVGTNLSAKQDALGFTPANSDDPQFSLLTFDSSVERGWMQQEADGTLQLSRNGSSLTNLTAANLKMATNYDAANFTPLAGFVKLVTSNGAIFSVTQLSTNLLAGP